MPDRLAAAQCYCAYVETYPYRWLQEVLLLQEVLHEAFVVSCASRGLRC